MEQFSHAQKESGINRVVGFDAGQEKKFLQYFKDKFETRSPDSGDKEKTSEQVALIDRTNKEMRDFLARYNINAVEIPADNVHILDRSKLTQEELREIQKRFGTESGFYSAFKQGVAIMKDYDVSKLSFLQTLVHESLHLQGFYSYQKSSRETADFSVKNEDNSASLNIRRSGFSIGTKDGKRRLFHEINESIITELQIRFENAYLAQWPELKEELKARDACIERVAKRDNAPIEEIRKVVASFSGYAWVTYPYNDERQEFNSLVDELYTRNQSDFESREDVFNLFVEATMNGRLLPVARLIEKTFGKGTFRTIGVNSANKHD